MSEPRSIRLKRLKMRAEHRGMREMDLILGAWAAGPMLAADDATLDLFEELMEEPDQDLYQWVSGQAPAPAQFAGLVAELTAATKALHQPGDNLSPN